MQTITKKRLHHFWTLLRTIRPLYLVIALLVSLAITVGALRHNNQTMVELRQAVYAADEANGDVEGALRELREYVHSHMNTNLSSGPNSVYPPIQLKYTYERLLSAENETLRAQNERIYTDAQAYCERLYPESYSGGPRVPCIRDYVTRNGGQEPKSIPDSLYKFDFVSPRWSPDLAGFSLIATSLIALLLAIRLVVPRVLRLFGVR